MAGEHSARHLPDRQHEWVELLSGLYDSVAAGFFEKTAAALGLSEHTLATKFGVSPPQRPPNRLPPDDASGDQAAPDAARGRESLSAEQKGARAGLVLLANVSNLLSTYAPDVEAKFREELATRAKTIPDFAETFIRAFGVVIMSRSVVLDQDRRIAPSSIGPVALVRAELERIGRAVTDEQKERVLDLHVDRVAVYALEYTSEKFPFKRALHNALAAMRGLDEFWKIAIGRLCHLQMAVKIFVLFVAELRNLGDRSVRGGGGRTREGGFSCLVTILYRENPILELLLPRPVLGSALCEVVLRLGSHPEDCTRIQLLLPLAQTDLESTFLGDLLPPFHVTTLFRLVWTVSREEAVVGGWLAMDHTSSGYDCRFWSATDDDDHERALEELRFGQRGSGWNLLKLFDDMPRPSAEEEAGDHGVLWLEDINESVEISDEPILPANLNEHMRSLFERTEPREANINSFTFKLLEEVQRFCLNNCFSFCRRLLLPLGYDPITEFDQGCLRPR